MNASPLPGPRPVPRFLALVLTLAAIPPRPLPAQVLGFEAGLEPAAVLADGAAAATLPESRWMRLPESVRRDLSGTFEAQRTRPSDLTSLWKEPLSGWEARGGDADPLGPGSWSQTAFDQVLSAEARRALLAVYVKVKAEGLWDQVGALGWLDASRGSAGIDFQARHGHEALRARARARGYVPDFMAEGDELWGLRSPEIGAQLHVRGPEPGKAFPVSDDVQIHIDLNNPGAALSASEVGAAAAALDYLVGGCGHVVNDLWQRGDTHTPLALMRALEEQGLAVLDVDVEPAGAGVALGDFLKWDTDGEDTWGSWFGHLWVKPHASQAGWWTEDEGARRFDRVRLLAVSASEVVFELTYPNGWVQATIGPDQRLRAAWYQASSGKLREFGGTLEEGWVRFP